MSKLIGVTFDEDTKTMDIKDGLCGIGIFLYYMVMIFLFGLLMFKTKVYDDLSVHFASKTFYRFLFYVPDTVVNIFPIFLVLIIKKQSLASIGLKKTNILKSILIGIIGSIPFAVLNMIDPINSGKTLNPNVSDWIWIFLYFLICIAFTEEIAFRGFIQTRIFGLIKNKWIGIIAVGFMFALMHVPFQMMNAGMPFLDFIIYDLRHLITTFIIHIYLVYLYTRDNNIIAPTITHALMDFCYSIFI